MFILEGNIGVGKSTFLSLIAQHNPEVSIVQEPVNHWAAERYGQSLLNEFYADPQRWTYTLETFAMISRSLDHVKQQSSGKRPSVMERSIYSGHYCFARNGREKGAFSDLEWDLYNQWANFIIHHKCLPPRGFIYLRATPSTCLKRINKRARSAEQHISLGYLEEVHSWHEKFLVTKENLDAPIAAVPVLILDADEEFIHDPQARTELLGRVRSFLELTPAEASPLYQPCGPQPAACP